MHPGGRMVMRMLVPGGNSQHQRFSLLEVIIVLVLLSTVLAFVLPKIGSVAWGIQRSAAIKTINSAFHMASSVASATGSPSHLIFNFEEGTLSVKRSNNGSQRTQNHDTNDELEFKESIFKDVEQFFLPEGTTYGTNSILNSDGSMIEYRFFPNGEAAGSQLSILIAGTYPLLIDVDRLTGKPLFSEYEK